jgi:hypothetical protein
MERKLRKKKQGWEKRTKAKKNEKTKKIKIYEAGTAKCKAYLQ